MLKPAPPWQFAVAYLLIAFPLVYLGKDHHPPSTKGEAIGGYVMIACGFGAALFLVRRSRADPFGWFGLVVYGFLVVGSLAAALIGG